MSKRLAALPWELLALLAPAAGLRFWDLGRVALIADESYYWLWSQRLALSYFDHPAGVALLLRLSTLVGGQGEVGVRWLNAAMGVAVAVLTYAIGRRLFSRAAATLAAALVAVGAPYLLISRFVYTDTLQLLLLLLNLWFMIPFLAEEQVSLSARHFWAAGLSMAALLNTRYSAYLYALAIAALLLCTRRDLLRDRRTWWTMGLAAAGLLPVLLWNATHQWASFRWQLQHVVGGALPQSGSFLFYLEYAASYLSPTLVLGGLLGALQVRGQRQRLLWVPAVAMTLPALLSPANSPRYLSAGLVLLLLLAAARLVSWYRQRWRAVVVVVAAAIGLGTGLWGLGTVLETWQPTPWPHSAAASALRWDSEGWRQAGQLLSHDPGVTVFAVDYGIASQLRYYSGLPVQTSWGQYRLWGIPAIRAVQVVALPYANPAAITERLRQDCAQVSGPTERALGEGKVLRLWLADDCSVAQETFLEHMDLLNLLREGGRP